MLKLFELHNKTVDMTLDKISLERNYIRHMFSWECDKSVWLFFHILYQTFEKNTLLDDIKITQIE